MQLLEQSLLVLPSDLHDALIRAFEEIRENYLIGRWEPSELNGGKLSEVVFRVLEWEASGRETYTPLGQHIRNFGTSVRRFENDTSLPDSVRFHLPQALTFLFTLRNKRGVGHAAGDISPNEMDSAAVLGLAKWVVAEVVRLLHGIDAQEASLAVEEVTTKESLLVWEVNGARRVLEPSLGYREKTLLVLHSAHPSPAQGRELFEWVEHPRWADYRKRILKKCHAERMIEFDEPTDLVVLSPKGIREAEQIVLELRAGTV